MFVPFEKLKDTSRIWIFQSSRKFNAEESALIKDRGRYFVEQWTAHSQNLLGSVEVFHQLFIVLAVDQSVNDASGCSIDKGFTFIRDIEKNLGVSLLDRRTIAHEMNGDIRLLKLEEFEKSYKSGELNGDVIIYNNLVDTKNQLESGWRVPAKDSWLMQLI